jgi:hypothetical protein
MIVIVEEELVPVVDDTFAVLDELYEGYHVPYKLWERIHRLKDDTPGIRPVIITEYYVPIVPSPVKNYIGLNRRYETVQFVDIRGDALPKHILLLHELVHCVGGNELDAEAVERYACDLEGCDPVITVEEIRAFRANPYGKYMKWKW